MKSSIAIIAALFILGGMEAMAQVSEAEYRLLTNSPFKKLRTIKLDVTSSLDAAQGASKEQIATDAEIALREKGLDVRASDYDGVLELYVDTVSSSDKNTFAVHVGIALRRPSTPVYVIAECANASTATTNLSILNCADFRSLNVPVWEKDDLWILGSGKLSTARQQASDLVKEFILAWLKAKN